MSLELVVTRAQTSVATLGVLCIDDEFICHTLEDPVRDKKIKGETAIPYGRYRISLYDSPKFGRWVPLLANVPGFTMIEIHPGNDTDDTDGCILVGEELQLINNGTKPWLTKSVVTFIKLFDLIERAIRAGEEVWISFRNAEDVIAEAG